MSNFHGPPEGVWKKDKLRRVQKGDGRCVVLAKYPKKIDLEARVGGRELAAWEELLFVPRRMRRVGDQSNGEKRAGLK